MSEIPLNKFEKEKKVIELHKQGKTIRQIAPEVHMAFRDISKKIKAYDKKIRLQQTKKEIENNQSNKMTKLSLRTQAFKLFRDGIKLTDVAIDLEIPADKAEKLWSQFLRLESMGDCYEFYQDHSYDIPTFLSINNFMKKNNVYGNNVLNILRDVKDLSTLQLSRSILKYEIAELEKNKNRQQFYQNNRYYLP